MSEQEAISRLCEDANRIAAQLRSGQPLKKRMQIQPAAKKPRAVRAYATGVSGKGNYLKLVKAALMPEVLAYCREFFADNDQLPTQACIAQRFGVTDQTGCDYLHRLARDGHIERNAIGRWRFTRRPGA